MSPVPRTPPAADYYALARQVGVDRDEVMRLYLCGVNPSRFQRLLATGVPIDLLTSLVDTPGLATPEDADALTTLWRSGCTAAEILDWARLGHLDVAQRLIGRDVSVAQAQSFPLGSEHDLGGLLRLVQAADQVSIRRSDLRLWFTGGVLRLEAPHLDAQRFQTWRAVGASRIGMRRAALSCAAGLSPQEAVALVECASFNEADLHLMAALR